MLLECKELRKNYGRWNWSGKEVIIFQCSLKEGIKRQQHAKTAKCGLSSVMAGTGLE